MKQGQIHIRPPRESESAACRMLLPDASADALGRTFLLAFDGPSIAGAVSYHDDGAALGGLRLHVIETRRRCRIGSRMIDFVIEQARNAGRARVFAVADLKNERAAEPFLAANGFGMAGRLTSARLSLEKIRALRRLFAQKLEGAAPLPASAQIVEIGEAPRDQVTRMCVEYLANMPLIAGMTRSFHPEQYAESLVLMLDGQVIGLALAQFTDRILRIPAWVVGADRQRARIGIRLLVELLDRVDGRADQLVFDYADISPTAKIAAQASAEIIKIAARLERVL